jgi:hypothetical protein
VLVALHATGIAQPLQFKQARAVAADSEFYPDLPHARNGALPDAWAISRPGETGPVWYRVTFDAENARANGELMALYIERACSSVAVLLNGKLIHVSGRLTEPVSRNCQRPQLISLPGALIEPRNNQLDLKLVGFPVHQVASRQRAAGLSVMELGSHATLSARYDWRTLFSIRLPQVIGGSLILVGSLIFAMGWLNRAQSFLAYYGALLIGWALVLTRQWLADLPWPNASSEFLLAILASFVTFAAVQFLLRHRLAVSLSEDDGQTWRWTRYLERDADPSVEAQRGQYHYPSIIQAADGTLHATYSYFAPTASVTPDAQQRLPRKSIKHAHFNEAWIGAR